MGFECDFFSDAVVSQVLDELGLQLTDQLSGMCKYICIYITCNYTVIVWYSSYNIK